MLTDEQVGACIDETERISPYGKHHFGWYIEFARAIEAETLKAHQHAIEAAVLAERKQCFFDVASLTAPPTEPGAQAFNNAIALALHKIRGRTQPMRTNDAHYQTT